MFDAKRFERAKLVPRTEVVEVPELKEYFNGKAEWVVRGLDGQELHNVKQAADKDNTSKAFVSAMYGSTGEKSAAFKELFGFGDGITEEYSKRIATLMIASVDPVVTREIAVKLAKTFPATVDMLTDKIFRLTGLGHQVGKPKDSGKTSASEKA